MSTASSAIESTLVENRVFNPSPAFSKKANIKSMAQYNAMCKAFETDFNGTWARLARENLVWKKPFTKVLDESKAPFYKWFDDGTLNASANCLDKHMGTPTENKTAIIFEGDDGQVTKTTYKELLDRVSQFANALKADGIKKGDRVLIYMPMTVEGVIAMQACARIGATHSVVFGGFSAKALQERIIDAGAVAVITANYQMRGGRELHWHAHGVVGGKPRAGPHPAARRMRVARVAGPGLRRGRLLVWTLDSPGTALLLVRRPAPGVSWIRARAAGLFAGPHRVRGGVAGPGHRLQTVRHRLRRAAPAGRRRPALAA